MNKIDQLIKRYHYIFNDYSIITYENVLKLAEEILYVKFTKSFHYISQFYNGENVKLFPYMYSYYYDINSDWNIITQTQKLRNLVNLPNEFIILAEPDESLVFMETNYEGTSDKVYWISIADGYNLVERKKLVDNPIIFPTFTDFFEYLLDEEEKLRQEDP